MTNTLGNQSNRRKTKYDTRSAEDLKKRVMSAKPKQVPKPKSIEKKVEGNGDLSFMDTHHNYIGFMNYLHARFPNEEIDILSKPIRYNRDEKVMKGSNPYTAIAFDMYLKEFNIGYRLATQEDLKNNLEFIEGYRVDTGLVLNGINSKIPNRTDKEDILFSQLEKKFGFVEDWLPVFIDLKGLELDKNLNFIFTDESRYFPARFMEFDLNTFSETDEYGLPLIESMIGGRKIINPSKRNFLRNTLDDGDFDFSRPFSPSGTNYRIVLAKQGEKK
jgi:hypothetical protein